MRDRTLWISLFAAVLFCGCALQEDVYTLDHRLSALERRNSELEKQNRELQQLNSDLLVAKDSISNRVEGLDKNRRNDEMALRGQVAGLSAQLDALRQESQTHAGRLEEMEYLVNKKLKNYEEMQQKNQERLDRMAMDSAAVQKRVAGIDQYLNLEGVDTQKPAPSKPTPAAAKPSDQAIYLDAKRAFDEGRLADSRKGFQQLIASYPKSQHADNSQFWIGETYYREKWYEKAILEYQKVIEKYPAGNKAPAAMLKQGLAFVKIGETNNARLVLKDLITKHPSTNEAVIAKQKLESL